MVEAVNGWNHRIRLRGVGKRAGGIDGTATAAAFGGVAGVRGAAAAATNGAERRKKDRIESRDARRGERRGGGDPSSEMDGGCAWPGRGGELCFPRRRVPPRPLGMGCACLVCFSGGGGGGVIKMMEGRWEDEWGFLSRLFRHSASYLFMKLVPFLRFRAKEMTKPHILCLQQHRIMRIGTKILRACAAQRNFPRENKKTDWLYIPGHPSCRDVQISSRFMDPTCVLPAYHYHHPATTASAKSRKL